MIVIKFLCMVSQLQKSNWRSTFVKVVKKKTYSQRQGLVQQKVNDITRIRWNVGVTLFWFSSLFLDSLLMSLYAVNWRLWFDFSSSLYHAQTVSFTRLSTDMPYWNIKIKTDNITVFFSAPAELEIKFVAVSKTVEVQKPVNFNLSHKQVPNFIYWLN